MGVTTGFEPGESHTESIEKLKLPERILPKINLAFPGRVAFLSEDIILVDYRGLNEKQTEDLLRFKNEIKTNVEIIEHFDIHQTIQSSQDDLM